MFTRAYGLIPVIAVGFAASTSIGATVSGAQTLANDKVFLTVNAKNGTYRLSLPDGQPVINARVGAEVDHQWLFTSDYSGCEASSSVLTDELGSSHRVKVVCGGRDGKPDLAYTLQIYDQASYGTLHVTVHNSTGKTVTVQAIRSVDAIGQAFVNLGGSSAKDRILSDSFSEDWPDLRIYNIDQAPRGLHRGVGSQLIYNLASKQSLFFGALTSNKFLTLLRLRSEGEGTEARIASYTVDSAGTTEIQKDFNLKNALPDELVELSLDLKPGEDLDSERLLFEVGQDYHKQLLTYGEVIHKLHRARIPNQAPMGWWSWTAYYGGINEGETLANADWQSEHLKSLGYRFFQIDDGYEFARGEFTTTNATQFPNGMRFVGHRITGDGLTLGVWTGPFEVTTRAWVYEHHQDWLVHNGKGQPIPLGKVWGQDTDLLYALDTTNPGAQEYLRQTYKTLVRQWGVRFIKLDFMDTTAIEGYYYRPNTTALEAQRIGLQIIRDAIGDGVLLDKDGSPMLNPVGLVDTGRISADTGHSFQRTKNAASGIAARFYMHRNFFVNDPDAFNVTDSYLNEDRDQRPPVSLAAAKASIALSAVSGGMYEIGDDMLLLGSEQERVSLVENHDLLEMAKVGRASMPLDLMTYEPEDEQPSIFFLREDPRQAMLVVFNWTNTARTRTVKLSSLGLRSDHTFAVSDVLNQNEPVRLAGGAIQIENQVPQTVKVIKIIDTNIAKAAPTIVAQVPSAANVGETINLSAQADASEVPAISYHWDFGDGTSAEGPEAAHCYTRVGEFRVQLSVLGIDGIAAQRPFSVKVTGILTPLPKLSGNRRFVEPTDE